MKNLHVYIDKYASKQFLYALRIVLIAVVVVSYSCSEEEDCEYVSAVKYDCAESQANVGDSCDSNNNGVFDGVVNAMCECIPEITTISTCSGFIANGDFELVTDDPNGQVGEDIKLATSWKALWQSGSLVDLFNEDTTDFGNLCFVAPTPVSGAFGAMWVWSSEMMSVDTTYREGLFNELSTIIKPNTGVYNMSFDYARMDVDCMNGLLVKVGVYGVYFPEGTELPENPTEQYEPSNLELFGEPNTVFLGEVVIENLTVNSWNNAAFEFDTNNLNVPIDGITHIMITNSHIPTVDRAFMYLGFDNFCLTN
ncbi:hypothetical protein [Bizionia paragorgiae]|jgi:hypothetical protein|uniref:hypothetical protein n=1 Tax=Bizionia paragorgiae TaxID=283786 RepID=UPI00299EE614|nr:hypothetical protein [Bizionia paragorgiae]MDX1270634.1 hypothetical protein [Bizionia paragorgiae]